MTGGCLSSAAEISLHLSAIFHLAQVTSAPPILGYKWCTEAETQHWVWSWTHEWKFSTSAQFCSWHTECLGLLLRCTYWDTEDWQKIVSQRQLFSKGLLFFILEIELLLIYRLFFLFFVFSFCCLKIFAAAAEYGFSTPREDAGQGHRHRYKAGYEKEPYTVPFRKH